MNPLIQSARLFLFPLATVANTHTLFVMVGLLAVGACSVAACEKPDDSPSIQVMDQFLQGIRSVKSAFVD